MEKVYKLDEIDCANCASKLEKRVSKIKGVNEVSINFMAQKMVLDVDNEDVLNKVKKVCAKYEPDCKLIG